MQSDLQSIGDPSAQLQQVNAGIAEIGERLNSIRKDAEGLRARLSSLCNMETEIEGHRTRHRQFIQESARIESGIGAIETRIREHQPLVARSKDIEAGVLQLEAAQEGFAKLESARQQYETLKRQQNELDRAIDIRRTRLESEAGQLHRRIKEDLTPLAQSEPSLVAELEDIQVKLSRMGDNATYMSDMRGNLQDLATAMGEAQSLAASYQTEGEQIREKLRLLGNSDPNSAVCPLCLSPLSQDGCLRLAQSYETEIEEKRELYRANQSTLRSLEAQKSALESELAKGERQHTSYTNQLQSEAARAETQLQAARSAMVELTAVEGQLGDFVASLKESRYALDERAQLKSVEEKLLDLGFEEESYRQTLQRVRELEPFSQLKVRLETAQAQLPQEELAHQQHLEMLQRMRSETESLAQQIVEAEANISEKPEIEASLNRVSREIEELDNRLQSAVSARGMLEGRLERLGQLKQELEQCKGRLIQTQEDQSIYQDLVGAFGRQGIQAMLIETVVPRLEEETNLLLGRMTDNRMHVKLETQRERRSGSGEPIETLEINVSDELGSRNYEMYSGGEAFRVNLALRIALSRVLSQRTGAPLPTLFIDEGFGSQDTSGRERILDVISAIEDDFDKIIVITHLDDMKDMFPVRIEVQKDANGSTFWLS